MVIRAKAVPKDIIPIPLPTLYRPLTLIRTKHVTDLAASQIGSYHTALCSER